MLKVWGRVNSINVQKVMWCIAELGLDHERTDAGRGFGGNDEDWYLAMNPNGLVPMIDDGGFVLWESNPIVRYLAARYGAGGLSPADPQALADADRWMEWMVTAVLSPLHPVFWGLIRTPEAERDKAAIAAAADKLADVLKILDERLSGRAFVLGDSLTIADIPLGAAAYRWYGMPLDHPDLPNLRAWYGRLAGRPAFQEHVMVPIT